MEPFNPPRPLCRPCPWLRWPSTCVPKITLPSRLSRLFPAVIDAAQHLFRFPWWGLVWIAALIAIVVLVRRKEWQAPAVIAAMSAVYLSAYTVTNWRVDDLISASADRLLMHMIGPALFAISRAIDVSAQNRYARPAHQPQSA